MSFQTDALRTKSDQFHLDAEKQLMLLSNLLSVMTIGALSDPLKKAIFYNKKFDPDDGQAHILKSFGPLHNVMLSGDLTPYTDQIHAILGILTELAEVIQPLLEHILEGKPLDKVNLAEEYGDMLWYIAIGLADLGVSMDAQQGRIIEKLRLRFPDKFTSEQAINRNLDEERKALEA